MKLKSQIEGTTQEIKPGNNILQLHITKPTKLKNPWKHWQKYTKSTERHQIRT